MIGSVHRADNVWSRREVKFQNSLFNSGRLCDGYRSRVRIPCSARWILQGQLTSCHRADGLGHPILATSAWNAAKPESAGDIIAPCVAEWAPIISYFPWKMVEAFWAVSQKDLQFLVSAYDVTSF